MKKKKTNPVLKILFVLFIIYISLYIVGNSGYYENKVNNQVILTEENIRQFENDVKNNKNIDIENYVKDEKIDYSNSISNLGDNVSIKVEKFMTEGLGEIAKVIKKMFS